MPTREQKRAKRDQQAAEAAELSDDSEEVLSVERIASVEATVARMEAIMASNHDDLMVLLKAMFVPPVAPSVVPPVTLSVVPPVTPALTTGTPKKTFSSDPKAYGFQKVGTRCRQARLGLIKGKKPLPSTGSSQGTTGTQVPPPSGASLPLSVGTPPPTVGIPPP